MAGGTDGVQIPPSTEQAEGNRQHAVVPHEDRERQYLKATTANAPSALLPHINPEPSSEHLLRTGSVNKVLSTEPQSMQSRSFGKFLVPGLRVKDDEGLILASSLISQEKESRTSEESPLSCWGTGPAHSTLPLFRMSLPMPGYWRHGTAAHLRPRPGGVRRMLHNNASIDMSSNA